MPVLQTTSAAMFGRGLNARIKPASPVALIIVPPGRRIRTEVSRKHDAPMTRRNRSIHAGFLTPAAFRSHNKTRMQGGIQDESFVNNQGQVLGPGKLGCGSILLIKRFLYALLIL